MTNDKQAMDGSFRYTALDGLRGYAAIAVVIYHATLFPIAARVGELLEKPIWALSGYERWARLLIASTSGETAVILFFTMSGAVLMRSLDREASRGRMISAVVLFPLRRVFRIYPALIGCLVGLYLAYHTAHALFPDIYPPTQIGTILLNATLYETGAHGATWTLKAEMLAIPFILIAFFLNRIWGTFGLAALLAYSVLILEVPSLSLGVWLLPGWLMYFVGGFVAYNISQSAVVQELMSGIRWVVVLAVAIFLRVCSAPKSNIGLLVQLTCVVILIAYLLSGKENALTKFLSWRVSVFFGKISYSLYLWNVIALNLILIPAVRWEWVRSHYLESGLLIGAAAIFISIPFAMVSEKYLERPFFSMWKYPRAEKPQFASALSA